MKTFFSIVLMVMMVVLLTPVAVMACGTCDSSPVLTATMEVWSDVVAGNTRAGPEVVGSQIKNYIVDDSLMMDNGKIATVRNDKAPTRATARTGMRTGGAAISAVTEPKGFANIIEFTG